MNSASSQEKYVAKIRERLASYGYTICEDVAQEPFSPAFLAKKTEFKLVRGGFISTIVIVSRLQNPTLENLKIYSSACYQTAKKSVRIHPPRGLMYGFLCIPLAVTDTIDAETQKAIKALNLPRHWAAIERLTVFATEDSTLHYSKARPAWGSLYHDLDATIIEYLLNVNPEP